MFRLYSCSFGIACQKWHHDAAGCQKDSHLRVPNTQMAHIVAREELIDRSFYPLETSRNPKGFVLPSWYAVGWNEGAIFAVLQSFGKTTTVENGQWKLGNCSPNPTRDGYPYDDGNINETFARGQSTAIAVANNLTAPHLYNVMADTNGNYVLYRNGSGILSTNNTSVNFGTAPYLGIWR